MADARRVIVIFVIAALFSILVNVSIDAFYPAPKYEDYCASDMYPKPMMYPETQACKGGYPPGNLSWCTGDRGYVAYRYNESGCATEAYCETCSVGYNKANESHSMIVFMICAITGLAALVLGLNLPQKDPLNEWVGSGFLIGGILTIAIGTGRYFGQMARFMRPIVILAELVLVIYLTYKKLGEKKPEEKAQK